MKHERLAISSKYNHRRALKDISEALEQKLSSSKDISKALWAITKTTPKDISEEQWVAK